MKNEKRDGKNMFRFFTLEFLVPLFVFYDLKFINVFLIFFYALFYFDPKVSRRVGLKAWLGAHSI